VARARGDSAALALAAAVGDRLLARRIPDRGRYTWKFREDAPFILPNFSHGAAGIGYFLIDLAAATGRPAFLQAAIDAGGYLERVARTDDGTFLVPYGWPNPDWNGRYDIGWAHGAAGTARFFERLWQATGDDRWMSHVEAAAEGIRRSGVPGPAVPGYGVDSFPTDLRFGTAGAAQFLSALAVRSGNLADLDLARRIADDILARGTIDPTGRYWTVPRPVFAQDAGAPSRPTGYLSGAAGYGVVFLQVDAALGGRPAPFALPDDPFGSARPETGRTPRRPGVRAPP
jgi:hypothetical protein